MAAQTPDLTRYAWLSIGAALLTIALKLTAYFLTNSVGLLSDALESLVNLATAIVALFALRLAYRPADEEYSYGYTKIEFFSGGFEGGMILLAAVMIAMTAIPRLLDPQPLEQLGLGLIVSVIASTINLVVARILMSAGRRHNSITLEADSRHLMTDVLTTLGVIVAVLLVSLTGWLWLDPVIALIVAANILFTGINLLRRSGKGLLDASLPEPEVELIKETLRRFKHKGAQFHALRTRSAGSRSFASLHVLVPGDWSVQRSHDLVLELEAAMREKLPNLTLFTHIEPQEDPASWSDTNLDSL